MWSIFFDIVDMDYFVGFWWMAGIFVFVIDWNLFGDFWECYWKFVVGYCVIE